MTIHRGNELPAAGRERRRDGAWRSPEKQGRNSEGNSLLNSETQRLRPINIACITGNEQATTNGNGGQSLQRARGSTIAAGSIAAYQQWNSRAAPWPNCGDVAHFRAIREAVRGCFMDSRNSAMAAFFLEAEKSSARVPVFIPFFSASENSIACPRIMPIGLALSGNTVHDDEQRQVN